jgi:hypothetical protein
MGSHFTRSRPPRYLALTPERHATKATLSSSRVSV